MPATPAREQIPPAYEPAAVERRIYEMWLNAGYFRPRVEAGRKPYCIIMPPPNVTGELHLGHGLEDALSDALVRWHRMQGDAVLWLPGEDHAGIATQNVIERELAKEGTTRQQIGRAAFVERTWDWVQRYRGRIVEQHQKLGASADWERDVFTLDPAIVRAVRTTFVNLYNDGLIYRGLRMINWCPRCETALSDLEVDYVEEPGKLYHLRYPIVGEGGMALPDAVLVATTRPETMVGDTGVAVHPNDERYEERIGRMLLLPLIGREIPVVADDAVKPEFGTGAVKVTPGHDPNDWEIGQRHDLPVIVAMDLHGRMNDEAGPYSGLTTSEAREAILRDLEEGGFLDHVEEHVHRVGHCSRCKTVLEPLPSEQWWVDVHKEYAPGASLASAAITAVTGGQIAIVPQRFEKVYLTWMENIRDWCVSRQLWWGHQIPVWYCTCGEMIVRVDDPERCSRCGNSALRQDEDVLDTWFSSALAPHADLGWPGDPDGDLRTFYPTADMQMGYDIMFFWCARMIMFGLYNMRERGPEGAVPFRNVLFHGLIRDQHGEKMTKSRGNVVDPLLAAGQYGADAFRFGLLTGSTLGQDQRYLDDRLIASRNFANKLWNSARYVLGKLGDQPVGRPHPGDRDSYAVEDRWILSRLEQLCLDVDSLLGAYQVGEAGRTIEDFLWNEFCDWYIEMTKVRLTAGDQRPLCVLAHVLDYGLRLLHPIMPFVTEELWQALRDHLDDMPPSLMIAWYPRSGGTWKDPAAEAAMEHVIEVNRAIRNLRAEKKLPPAVRAPTYLRAGSQAGALRETLAATAFTSRVEPHVLAPGADLPAGDYAFARVGDTGVAVALPQADSSAERSRLEKELVEAEAHAGRLSAQLASEQFRSRAPANVIGGVETTLAETRSRIAGLRERLGEL